jgi:hypothetical protein
MPFPLESDDPLPLNAIRLSEAFELYYRSTEPDAAAVDAELFAATEDADNSGWTTQTEKRWHKAYGALMDSLSRSERSFRDRLTGGQPMAFVRDPQTGETLKLNHRRWGDSVNFGNPGFNEDFVSPDHLMQPGPCTYLNGSLRPVFFEKNDFLAWLSAIAGADAQTDQQEIGDQGEGILHSAF